MAKPEQPKPEPFVQLVDLRSITRSPKKCLTTVMLYAGYGEDGRQQVFQWLKFGEAQLRHNDGTRDWVLAARMTEGVTDFEHDSAYAMHLPLIGVEFERYVEYSQVTLYGWIHPDDALHFRVPSPGYDPTKHPKAMICKEKHCEKPHAIVPEGYYSGPPAGECLDLYKRVRGRRVQIVIGRTPNKDEEGE